MARTLSTPAADAPPPAPARLAADRFPAVSIRALTQAYADGRADPRDQAERYLEAIGRAQPRLNAFAAVAPSHARPAAEASARRWRRGTPLSALDGVPISIKDMFDVAGLPSRRGSRTTSPAPVPGSAPVVRRLIDAGAVILGLTTTAEFGGAPVTISPLTGVTRNAWNPERTAGGSSGGAAVSVAAGLCMAALASDTGGSIRLPAAFNGVVGLKPTGGRLPTNPASVLRTLGCPGPIARSVADCSDVFAVLADPRFGFDEPIHPAFEGPADAEEPLRLGFSARLGFASFLEPEVEQSFAAAVAAVAGAGVAAAPVQPAVADPVETFLTHTRANYAFTLSHLDGVGMAQLSEGVRASRAAGQALSATDLLAAFAARELFAQTFRAAFKEVDVLMTPAVAAAPFAADGFAPTTMPEGVGPRAWSPFGYPVNLSEQPALVLPCGRTADGMPLAVQLIARKWREDQLLAMAARLESIFAFDNSPPLALTAREARYAQ